MRLDICMQSFHMVFDTCVYIFNLLLKWFKINVTHLKGCSAPYSHIQLRFDILGMAFGWVQSVALSAVFETIADEIVVISDAAASDINKQKSDKNIHDVLDMQSTILKEAERALCKYGITESTSYFT